MSLQQSKILLDKINSLYQNISIDGEISTIERDLMLSYVRQFYESILDASETKPIVPPAPKVAPAPVVVVAPPPPPVVVEVTPPPIEVVEPIKVVPPPPPIELIVTPPPAPKVVVEVAAPAPPPKPVVEKPVVERPTPARAAAAKPLIKPTVERVESNQLFEEKMSKELSDKLGEMPIADIKQGMSFNERIIFQNELFDSNSIEFENALTNLNNAVSFEAAKAQLSILAIRFDWSSKEKQAKAFIRLVRRRHN
jgi:hypothetical protein